LAIALSLTYSSNAEDALVVNDDHSTPTGNGTAYDDDADYDDEDTAGSKASKSNSKSKPKTKRSSTGTGVRGGRGSKTVLDGTSTGGGGSSNRPTRSSRRSASSASTPAPASALGMNGDTKTTHSIETDLAFAQSLAEEESAQTAPSAGADSGLRPHQELQLTGARHTPAERLNLILAGTDHIGTTTPEMRQELNKYGLMQRAMEIQGITTLHSTRLHSTRRLADFCVVWL
jgi:hypothetical protein